MTSDVIETTTHHEQHAERQAERTERPAEKRGTTMTIAEAQQMLKVSKAKIARLIKAGDLPATEDPLDKRFKLVERADVEALLARSQRQRSA